MPHSLTLGDQLIKQVPIKQAALSPPPSAKWHSPPPLITSPPPLEPPSRLELGQLGEQLCARHLEAEGYELEALNWRGRSGELDLVARQGSTLVVIEVRTTRGDWLERPAEAVTLTKQRQVARCADEYLRSRPQLAPPVEVIRFDVVGVRLTPPWSQPEVSFDHEEGAFESPWAF